MTAAQQPINLEEYLRMPEAAQRFLEEYDDIAASREKFEAYASELCGRPRGWWEGFLKEIFKRAYGKNYPDDFTDVMTPELRKELSNPNHISPGWDYEVQPSVKALKIRTAKALRKLLLGRWEVLQYLEPPEVALLMKLWCDINII